MARPEKHDHEKRTETLRFRCTIAEKEHVLQQANKLGLKLTDYSRNRTLGHRVEAPSRPNFDPALVSELNSIGVNVNQLTRAVHRGREFADYWEDIGSRLEAVLDKLVGDDT